MPILVPEGARLLTLMFMSIAIEPAWIEPTWFIDSDSAEVAAFVENVVGGASGQIEMAVALFYAVRDGIRYDPYVMQLDPAEYKASTVALTKANWCTPKSVLLTAAARHCGIPARLGFADVRNHLTTEKLSERMGTDLFIWHGYTEFLLDGNWLKASSAFNIELCERFGVKVLDFDGTADALMHPYNVDGDRHMEYVNQRGSFDDLPLDDLQADFRQVYGSWVGEEGVQTEPSDVDEAFAEQEASTP